MQPDKEIDTRGLNCPLPILRTKKALSDVQSGQVLKVEMNVAINGRRRFRGTLLGAQGDAARILRDDTPSGEPAEVLLPIADMTEARLVLTNALITEALKRSKSTEPQNDNQDMSASPAGEPRRNQFRRASGNARHAAQDMQDKGE